MFLCVVYHRRAVTKSSLSFLGIHFHVIESRSELSSPRQQNRSAGTLTTFSFLTAIELMLNRWQKGIFPANRCVAQYVVVAPFISVACLISDPNPVTNELNPLVAYPSEVWAPRSVWRGISLFTTEAELILDSLHLCSTNPVRESLHTY